MNLLVTEVLKIRHFLKGISLGLPFLISLSSFGQSYVIVDHFDDNRYTWYEGDQTGGSSHIRDGKMYTDFPERGWILTISPYIAMNQDFRAEISVKQTAGVTNNGVGLVWGYSKGKKDQNYFIVNGMGMYYIYDSKEGETKPGVGQWMKSSAVKPMGQANLLRVEQRAGSLIFSINGEKVVTTSKVAWPGHEIGVITFVKMTVEFDDLRFEQDGLNINLPPNLTKGLVKQNMGEVINTKADDLTPKITADGRTLYFGREYYEGNLGGLDDGEDFYVSSFNGTTWSPAQNMGSPVNSTGVDNISSISTDNNTVLYASGSKFLSRSRSSSGWGEPQEIGITFVNEAKHFESCYTADGKAMLFTAKNSSNLFYDISLEERDIYVSTQNADGSWTVPANLGPTVNTIGNEVGPFLAADGRTLYFSTDGRPGFGSNDIFMTKRIGEGWSKWSEPVNLGPEINTTAWDAYYVVPASGDYAYLVSDLNGFGKSDIVRIKLSNELKPNPVVLVLGKTLDAKTKKPISANVLVDNLGTTKEVGEAISDPKTGDFRIVLTYGANYGFHAAAQGYLSVNENMDLTVVSKYTELEKDLYLVPITVGTTIQLNNVFFEQAKAILKPESYPELDRLIAIMNENPDMEIEIGGHTDNVGRAVSLTVLSQDRVGTVKKYMMDHGIAGRRITGKGYGPSKPLVKNDTEEHRRMNRRVEFKIVKK